MSSGLLPKFKLLDFNATWCGPCRALSPILDAVAKKYEKDGLVVEKIDVDKDPSQFDYYTKQRNAGQSIPFLVLLEKDSTPNGYKVLDHRMGFMKEDALSTFLNGYIRKQ